MKYILALFFCLALAVTAGWLLGPARAASPEAARPAPAGAVPSASPAGTPTPGPRQETSLPVGDEPLLGVWVPYFSLTPPQPTRAAFEENFRAIAAGAKAKGLNALFVHVRPFCDALYPSALYPWSHLLTGEQGRDPGWDPLAFMVEEAHAQGLAFHAWVNPLRVKTAQSSWELAENNPAVLLQRESPDCLLSWEGSLWLDPAWPRVRTLVARGVEEIVARYPVDGVHFDDYFYPAADPSLDQTAYAAYCQQAEHPLSLEEWRCANIDALLQECYRAVKTADPDCQFGVSPQGNLANDLAMGADVAAWCAAPGTVDYLCPQLYYSFENPALGYGEALAQWQALPKWDGLQLYAGLALYKRDTDADGGTWSNGVEQIRRQARAAREAACAGVILYAWDDLDRWTP